MNRSLWLLLVCALGCSAREAPRAASTMAAAEAPVEASAVLEAPAGSAERGGEGGPSSAQKAARAVIRSAALHLSHEAPAGVTERAASLARAAGGYVLDGSTQTAQGSVLRSTVVLRVPEPAFEATLAGLRELAALREESITGQDVTDEFVDTEARLRALRTLAARLLGLLEQSGKLSDLLQVEQELARVNAEIERHEGRLRYLRERTAMATITLTVHAPEQPYVPPSESVVSRLRNALHAGAELAVSVLEAGIVALGFALPAAAGLALFGGPALWLARRWRRRQGAGLVAS